MSNRRREGASRAPRFIISSILAFVFAVVLTMLSYLLGGYFGFLNPGHMIRSMEREKYYEKVNKYFHENVSDMNIPMGIPDEVTDDIVSVSGIKKDVNGYLKANMDGGRYEVNTNELEKTLTARTVEYLTESGVRLSKEQKASVNVYTQMIAEEYRKDVEFPMISYVGAVRGTCGKLVKVGAPVCIITALAAVVLLLKLRHWKHRALRFIIYGTLACSAMTAVLPVFGLADGFYKRLNVAPEHFYRFMAEYLRGSLMIFVWIALGWAVVSVVLLVMVHFMKRKAALDGR